MKACSSQMGSSSEGAAIVSRGETIGGTCESNPAEARIIAANRDFFQQIAGKYDSYESCSSDRFLQNILEADLERIHSCFASQERKPRCLDCGGGTGNLALKLLARGWDVTVVDNSEEMLDAFAKKADAKGFVPKVIGSSIEQFLAATRGAFDLVAFSSVLHHLYSYPRVVGLAATRVHPGGFFYSNFDPVIARNPFWTHAFDSIEIAAAKVVADPRDVLPGIWRRTRKLFRRHDSQFSRPVVWAGDLAEYHAKTGVDDWQIMRLLESKGFAIVEHTRYPVGRTRAGQILNKRLRLLENFKVIARRGE